MQLNNSAPISMQNHPHHPKSSPQPRNPQQTHHKPIAQHPVHPRPEPRIGDARFAGVAGRVDDGEPLADHRGREGRGQGIADLDKAAAPVGHQQHRVVQGPAAAPLDLVADDLGRNMTGAATDIQQIAAYHQRQAAGREGEARQEEDRFDRAALSCFGEAVKYPTPVREKGGA